MSDIAYIFSIPFFFLFFKFYLLLAALGLCFCVRAFSGCSKQGPPLVVVHGILIVVGSLALAPGL